MPESIFNVKLIFFSSVNSTLFNINLKSTKTKKTSLKNYLYFLCLYNYIFNRISETTKLSKLSIISFPRLKKNFTLLRAPFRHKLTKKNYTLIRYKVGVFFTIRLQDKIKIINVSDLANFFKSITESIYWFETSTYYLHKVRFSTIIWLKKFKL